MVFENNVVIELSTKADSGMRMFEKARKNGKKFIRIAKNF